MSKRNKQPKPPKADDKSDDVERCPKCGLESVMGLVRAFWWPIDSNDDPRWDGESEISEKRRCSKCEHEWEDGDGDDD
jgi:ribosomal protein S27AE